MSNSTQSILFTRQRHDAERAGLHYDYRIVVGDKAYSWATKRELPEPGKAIILWEQPVHTADYALSQRVEIPSGQYGAGTTTLDWIKKGTAKFNEDKITVETKGSKFLIKKMPEHYGKGAWLFKRVDSVSENKYLEKISSDLSIASKSHAEESKAIHDYTERLKDAKSPELKKAIEHARSEEKDHASDFKRVMSKEAELREELRLKSKLGGNRYLKRAKAIKPHSNKSIIAHNK